MLKFYFCLLVSCSFFLFTTRMKTFILLTWLVTIALVLPTRAQSQTGKAVPTAKPITEAKPTGATALVTDKVEAATPSSDALKVKVDSNPVTKRLTVRTNISGPVRVEVNDDEGHPIITRDMIVGNQDAVLDISRLPAGYYIVNCTAGERRGMRRIMLGQ